MKANTAGKETATVQLVENLKQFVESNDDKVAILFRVILVLHDVQVSRKFNSGSHDADWRPRRLSIFTALVATAELGP